MTDTTLEETSNAKKTNSPQKDQANATSPKSSPTKKDIDIATQALNHFAQGKRHLLVNDITSAVNSLQEACRLLGEHYGETAPECGDAYFYYGKALLELARIENGVLGNALDGEGSTEEENDDEDSQDEETSQEEAEDGPQENGDVEEEGEQTESGEEEEIGNLQLAWEMLELSKVIYSKQVDENPAMNLKIAQVHLKLGEVSLENENYGQSIEDFKQCLSIQTKELEPYDRCLAETHYQMGVAYSFSDEYDKAIESFSNASKVIEDRISNLKKKQIEKSEWTDEQKKKHAQECKDPFYTEQTEIDELSGLLPEIKEKIVDMEELKKDSKEKLQKIKNSTFANLLGGSSKSNDASVSGESSTGFSQSSSFQVDSNKPASNITHLVRKKRKPEDEVEKEDCKKAKSENGEDLKPDTTVENGIEKCDEKIESKKENSESKLESKTEVEMETT